MKPRQSHQRSWGLVMRLLVSIPGISYRAFSKTKNFKSGEFMYVGEFLPTERTLDSYSIELCDIHVKYMWGLNVPHWPLKDRESNGIAGPGKPVEELFSSKKVERSYSGLLGKYDKWRPYPAEAVSMYSKDMAKRFSYKRCRVFEKMAKNEAYNLLFYVEHSPTSLAHLSVVAAMPIATDVISSVLKTARALPSCPLAIFSPYGPNGEPGFYATNGVDCDDVPDWNAVRSFMNGDRNAE